MAKFPTEVEHSITVNAARQRAYDYLWDVIGSSQHIPGLDQCERVAADTYRFIFEERSTGPVKMVVQYTAKYSGDGQAHIVFEGVNAQGDNTEVSGSLRFQAVAGNKTKVVLKQMLAPDTPVPRLLQGFLKSFVVQEAATAVKQYLSSIKQALESTDASS